MNLLRKVSCLSLTLAFTAQTSLVAQSVKGTKVKKKWGRTYITPRKIDSTKIGADGITLPFYMSFPQTAMSSQKRIYRSLKAKNPRTKNRFYEDMKLVKFYEDQDMADNSNLYLRGLLFSNVTNINADIAKGKGVLSVSAFKNKKSDRYNRRKVVRDLVNSGLLRTGDVVLSYRLGYAQTVPYAHLQLGISHAGLIVVDKEEDAIRGYRNAYNIDMPLGPSYNQSNDGDVLKNARTKVLNSQLDSKHYIETPIVHVIRPRVFNSEEYRNNLLNWVRALRANYTNLRKQLPFNGNYLENNYSEDFLANVANIIKGKDKSSSYKMFCSEFVWAMLSLSSCKPTQTIVSSKSEDGKNECVPKNIFNPVQLVSNFDAEGNSTPGLLDAPKLILDQVQFKGDGQTQKFSAEQKLEILKTELLTAQVSGKVDAFSTGHEAVAESPQVKAIEMFAPPYYKSKLGMTLSEEEKFILNEQIKGVIIQTAKLQTEANGGTFGDEALSAAKIQAEGVVKSLNFDTPIAAQYSFAGFLNQGVKPTYTPASFVLQTLAENKTFDYVYTLGFWDNLDQATVDYRNINPISKDIDEEDDFSVFDHYTVDENSETGIDDVLDTVENTADETSDEERRNNRN